MEIIHYPHPTLRFESKSIKRVDAELHNIVREMFDLMYAANGVGLAANQVGLPLRLFVVNLKAQSDEGEELAFINPVITRPKGLAEQEEGCLSIPQVYGEVKRPKQIRINAYNLQGQEIVADVDGLLARVLQHENDHLDGVLFTDRLSATGKVAVDDALHEFEVEFESRRGTGDIPSDEEIAANREQWIARYC